MRRRKTEGMRSRRRTTEEEKDAGRVPGGGGLGRRMKRKRMTRD